MIRRYEVVDSDIRDAIINGYDIYHRIGAVEPDGAKPQVAQICCFFILIQTNTNQSLLLF